MITDFPEVSSLQPGEVLIVPYTDVGWTPFYSLASKSFFVAFFERLFLQKHSFFVLTFHETSQVVLQQILVAQSHMGQ